VRWPGSALAYVPPRSPRREIGYLGSEIVQGKGKEEQAKAAPGPGSDLADLSLRSSRGEIGYLGSAIVQGKGKEEQAKAAPGLAAIWPTFRFGLAGAKLAALEARPVSSR